MKGQNRIWDFEVWAKILIKKVKNLGETSDKNTFSFYLLLFYQWLVVSEAGCDWQLWYVVN